MLVIVPGALLAAEGTGAEEAGHAALDIPLIFLWIAIILMLAKVSSLVERLGQPAVLGELLIGVACGSLYLVGIDFFDPIKSSPIIHFMAELGVVILLFQIGIESSVKTMMKVGVPSFLVACVGVILPLCAIYFLGPLIVPGLSSTAYLFLGATMTATSVGITARVLQDLNQSNCPEARIIIGAAVIDDVLGLIILAVVSAIVTRGTVDVGTVSVIVIKAVVFLGGGVLLGTWLAPRLSRFFSAIHTGIGMKFAVVISFGLVFAYLAALVGLAPIVGAFTAGLILTPVYFNQFSEPPFIDDLRKAVKEVNGSVVGKIEQVIETHSHKHIEEFTSHLGHFFLPIFFVLTGMQVKIAALYDMKVLVMSLLILVIAIITKVVAGLAAGRGVSKLTVGVGMIPRGEVGLIFANMGKAMGVMDDTVFSAIVVVIMLTTLITPPMLAAVFKRAD
ncbi:MAG: cation:proton antiporter [Deltaproteobacteria bacterium]|nr:cation:proton antiporter [Deltaproteobacteria bacterium]